MTNRHDDIPTIGTVGAPPDGSDFERPRRGPFIAVGLAAAAFLAFAVATQPSERVTLETLPSLPPIASTVPAAPATPISPMPSADPVTMPFDRAPFTVNLPAFAASDGASSWVFSAAEPDSGLRPGTGLVAYSTQGDKWTDHGVVLDAPVTFWSIGRTGGWFAAAGFERSGTIRQRVFVSRDGLDWSELTPPGGQPVTVVAASTGIAVATYPGIDPDYVEVLRALPEGLREGVLTGRLDWWLPADSELAVSVGPIVLGRFELSELGVASSDLIPGSEDFRPGLWVTADEGETWAAATLPYDDFFPQEVVALDAHTVLVNAWIGNRSTIFGFDGATWTELEDLGALGLTAEWNGWYLALRGAQVLASRDLQGWEVVLQIPPVRQQLAALFVGPDRMVATYTTDLPLSEIEPTSLYSIPFDAYTMHAVFDYASVSVFRNNELLVRHMLNDHQESVASLDGDFVVIFDTAG
ncbi:MAG: hypothetical protein OEO77_11745, partial [Acidimicrobiia bacterium]|nr:hypothetical protein [Acidimicrobiia bacterium]